jgi:hypothetical protein
MHIVANPFTNLRLERPKGRKDLDALTEPEIRELADAVVPALGMYGAEFRAILIFLAYVGCRPGELCCIRRADLDRESAEVTIRFALDGQGGERSPKNGRPRVVTVPPLALAALADVPTWLTGPYLFHATTGRRLSKGSPLTEGQGFVRPRTAVRHPLFAPVAWPVVVRFLLVLSQAGAQVAAAALQTRGLRPRLAQHGMVRATVGTRTHREGVLPGVQMRAQRSGCLVQLHSQPLGH